MTYFIKCLKNYAVFQGRAQRAEYWYFMLFHFLIGFIINMINSVVFYFFYGFPSVENNSFVYRIIMILYTLIMLTPLLAVSVRRLHDVGKNGWTMLFVLLPILGPIYLFILFIREGDLQENKYGTNPKIVKV